MRLAEWLTYIDIEQLRKINNFYDCEVNQNSKNELICSILERINRKSHIKEIWKTLDEPEQRFFQQLVFDHCPSYTMEELLAKGKIALQEQNRQPRAFAVEALKRGWLFPGYSMKTKSLFFVPSDIRDRIISMISQPYKDMRPNVVPSSYKNEEGLLVTDTAYFLNNLQREIFRLTNDGAIYKQQLRQIFQSFFVPEEPISAKGPRFGYGRHYHFYPDRFSLIYDYSFYKEYIAEDSEGGYLSITDLGKEKYTQFGPEEGKEIYRFWLRIYRRPIPHLPIIIRWIGLLARDWISVRAVYQASESWLNKYYYETVEANFQRILQMLVHLGVIILGSQHDDYYLKLTKSGLLWLEGISAFNEHAIDESFMEN